MQWNLVVASWNSREPGYGYLNGYWIFRTDGPNMCWKLDHNYRQHSGPYFDGLTLWNADSQAVGTPQDYELFNFVANDPASLTVKIKQAFGGFVGLDNETLTCNAAVQENPAIFVVNFL